jgi:hypothetical protein
MPITENNKPTPITTKATATNNGDNDEHRGQMMTTDNDEQ